MESLQAGAGGGAADLPPGPEWLRAGRVGRPHGLDGSFLVVEPNTALLRACASVAVGGRQRAITRVGGHAGRLIVRLEGCRDRAAAQALHGQELLVARSLAPALGEDEWWAEELEGLAVSDGDRVVGTVARLLALPSCEVLEVVRVQGGAPLLVPLVSDAVRAVDLERGRIDVDLRFLGEEPSEEPGGEPSEEPGGEP
ncbi:MAG: ribosome maturation factor RimM [Actinomycetota bacterium]|nr:ribosome maturation factor RimM [Actinomycetota bacterium]